MLDSPSGTRLLYILSHAETDCSVIKSIYCVYLYVFGQLQKTDFSLNIIFVK